MTSRTIDIHCSVCSEYSHSLPPDYEGELTYVCSTCMEDMPEVEWDVVWVKNYYLQGTQRIRAKTKKLAEHKVKKMLGDFGLDDGKLELDTGNDYTEAYRV